METKIKKCSKCGKELPLSDFAKDLKSTDGLKSTCKRCQRKKTIFGIIVALLLAAGIGYAIFAYSNRPIESFDGAVETTEISAPDFIFNIGDATAMTSPIDINGTVDNIESFKQLFAKAKEDALQNGTSQIIIPSIGILFAINEYNQTSSELIKIFAETYLQTNEEATIIVEGYTCDLGSSKYNQVLSEKRAQTIAHYLEILGVHSDKIQIKAYGEDKYGTLGLSTREENRRVNVSIK